MCCLQIRCHQLGVRLYVPDSDVAGEAEQAPHALPAGSGPRAGATGQHVWSWSIQVRWSFSNGSWHIAQAYSCASSIAWKLSGVRPKRLSLCALFQRVLASGVASLPPRRRSVSRNLRSARAAGVRHSPRWPGIRPQCALARGIHLPHRSPVGWPLAGMVLTHLVQSQSPWGAPTPHGLACCRGRCWVRTSDLLGVNEARSHCANRPRGGGGNRTRVQGFAGPCLSHSATPPAPTFLWGNHGFGHPKYRAGLGPAGRNPAPPSGRRDSNPRPSPWQGDALPTEPRPHAGAPPTGLSARAGVRSEL